MKPRYARNKGMLYLMGVLLTANMQRTNVPASQFPMSWGDGLPCRLRPLQIHCSRTAAPPDSTSPAAEGFQAGQQSALPLACCLAVELVPRRWPANLVCRGAVCLNDTRRPTRTAHPMELGPPPRSLAAGSRSRPVDGVQPCIAACGVGHRLLGRMDAPALWGSARQMPCHAVTIPLPLPLSHIEPPPRLQVAMTTVQPARTKTPRREGGIPRYSQARITNHPLTSSHWHVRRVGMRAKLGSDGNQQVLL